MMGMSYFPTKKEVQPLPPGEMKVTRLSTEELGKRHRRLEDQRINALLREPIAWHLTDWCEEQNISHADYQLVTSPRTDKSIPFAEDEAPATTTGTFNLGDEIRTERERAERINIGREGF